MHWKDSIDMESNRYMVYLKVLFSPLLWSVVTDRPNISCSNLNVPSQRSESCFMINSNYVRLNISGFDLPK